MNENHFKIELITKKVNYNIKACGFSPSFVTDVYQNVKFGFQNQVNSYTQIFYGINDSLPKKSHFDANMRAFNSEYESGQINNIIQKADKYFMFKKIYKKKYKNQRYLQVQTKKVKNKNLLQILNPLASNRVSNNHFLQKDNDEESFFNQNYQKYLHLLNNLNDTIKQKNYNLEFQLQSKNMASQSNFSSPGFLNSEIISSGTTTLSSVNSTFYVIYNVDSKEESAEILLDREFISSGEQNSRTDNSMLSSHFDYLLYYDKQTKVFTYDNDWALENENELYPSSYFWKMMKWFLALIIIIFSIILVVIIVAVTNYAKKHNICCFKDKYSNQPMNQEDYDQNISYPNHRRHMRRRLVFNPNNLEESELETICYSPNLDAQVTYENNSKNKSKSINCYQDAHDSDSYTYEYESDSYDEENIESINDINENNNIGDDDDDENNNGMNRKVLKPKKKVKRIKLNSSAPCLYSSPYELDVGSCSTLGEVRFSSENLANELKTNDNISNGLGDDDENTPNPYGLPSLVCTAKEDNDDDFKPPYPPVC